MAPEQKTFVQVVELWLPDGDALRCQSGFYGAHTAFAEVSARTRLPRGEGLPGAALLSGRAHVWESLGSMFVRAEAAALAGLDAGAAIPFMKGDECVAVVSLLCGSKEHTGGCIELWQPNTLRELAHESGYYGRLARFETISRLLRFHMGRGLPGKVWQSGAPEIIEDVRESSSFLRAAAARDAGVGAGIAMPLYHGEQINQIVTLLSAQATPLAAGFEVWLADERGLGRRTQAYYAPALAALGEARRAMSAADDALVRDAFQHGLPRLALASSLDAMPLNGFDAMLVMPVRVADQVTAVVVLFL